MGKLVFNIFSVVASFASLFSLIYIFKPNDKPWTPFLLFLFIGAIILMIVLIIFNVYDYIKSKSGLQVYKNKQDKINKYMYNWIKQGENVAIFTRDLSWVQKNNRIKDLLVDKAKKNELNIYLPKKIELVYELEKNGAKIIEYGKYNYKPKSRFTIIHFNKHGSQVAIGGKIGKKHFIKEFGMDELPYHLANDLINLIEIISK